MSSQQAQAEYGAFGNFVERIGIPRPLFWGFVAAFIFMIGDGVEISRLPGYLAGPGGLNGAQASLITGTVYGLAVMIAAFVGPFIASVLNPLIGYGGVVVTYSALYFVCAVLTWYIKDASDPGEEGEPEEATVATTA